MATPEIDTIRARRDAIVDAHIAAETEQHDVAAALATFRRPRYEVPAMGAIVDGADEVHGLLTALLTAFPDFWLKRTATHHAAESVIVECRFGGTHRGPWAGIEATGKQMSVEATCIFLFDGDQLICEKVYFDHATVLSQIGGMTTARALIVPADIDRWGRRVSPNPFLPATKISARDTGGAWSMFDGITPPGCRVPLHVHRNQDEWFWVLNGKFQFEVGDERFELTAGTSILAPRRVAHRWKNSHESEGRMLVMVQPAGGLEQFFDRVSRLTPEQLQDLELINRMFVEYDMEVLGPPLAD